MTHPLTEIRRAAVALLQTRFQNVYGGRGLPSNCRLPCVLVYVDGRRSEQLAMSPVSYQHSVNLAVTLCVQSNQDADTLAETMLGEVETLFAAHNDLNLGQRVQSLTPSALNIEQDDTGEIQTIYYQQIFKIIYFQETE